MLSFTSLFEGNANVIAAKAQWEVLCKRAGVPMYEWAPKIMATYINTAASLQKLAKLAVCIVPKAARVQFLMTIWTQPVPDTKKSRMIPRPK